MATAITDQIREQGVLPAVVLHPDPMTVRLMSPKVDVSVLATDWELILPYLRDGSFDPALYPVGSGGSRSTPLVGQDPLYLRILGVLLQLFPDAYPTSNL